MSILKWAGLFGLVALAGAISLVSADARLIAIYAGVVASASFAVSAVGFLTYMRQEEVDKREVRGEYRAQDRAEIARLAESNIQLQKDLYAAEERCRLNTEEKSNVACVVGGRMGSD